MLRRRLSVSAGALLAATAFAVPAGAAQAATAGPWQHFSAVGGSAVFVRMGHVAGHPGNAHSGEISFDTSDDATAATLNDWRCPAGQIPPDYRDPSNSCVLLLTVDYSDPTASDPTFSGPLNATYLGKDTLVETFPEVKGVSRTADVRVRWARTGPISRTFENETTATLESHTVESTAPMRIHGIIDWVNLDSPRVRTEVTSYGRVDEKYRFFS